MTCYYRVPGWTGRLGNNLLQVSHGIFLAKKYQGICTYPEHELLENGVFDFSDGSPVTSVFDEKNAGNFFQTHPRYTIDNQNYQKELYEERPNILKEYVLPLFKPYKKIDFDYDLAIHFRGGDCFYESTGPQYVQAPLSYFLYILKKENPKKVLLICEDNNNPVIEKLRETDYNVDIHLDDNIENDANKVLNSKTFVIGGISTFSIVLSQMSPNLQKVYYPEFEYCLNNNYPEEDHWYQYGNLLGKMNCEVIPVKFLNYPKIGELSGYSLEERKNQMLQHSIQDLYI